MGLDFKYQDGQTPLNENKKKVLRLNQSQHRKN
jgi:hypothetical protein